MADAARRFDDSDDIRPWTPDLEHRDDTPEGDVVQFFPFLHQGDEFVLGFEAGEVYTAMNASVPAIEGNFSERNKGELLRMAAHFNYKLICWSSAQDGLAFARFVL